MSILYRAEKKKCPPEIIAVGNHNFDVYWHNQHRYLTDRCRVRGVPNVFLTIAPAEWKFPLHSPLFSRHSPVLSVPYILVASVLCNRSTCCALSVVFGMFTMRHASGILPWVLCIMHQYIMQCVLCVMHNASRIKFYAWFIIYCVYMMHHALCIIHECIMLHVFIQYM